MRRGNLKAERVRLGLTQTQEAELIGVSKQSISNWENALSKPSVDQAIALSELLGVSVKELMEVTDAEERVS